jgi:hypothetical protein
LRGLPVLLVRMVLKVHKVFKVKLVLRVLLVLMVLKAIQVLPVPLALRGLIQQFLARKVKLVLRAQHPT